MHSKGFSPLIIGIIIAVVLIVGAGGYLALQKRESPAATDELQGFDESQNALRVSPSDQVTGWDVYRNKESGFELSYPRAFEFEDKGEVPLSPQRKTAYNHWLSITAPSATFSEYLVILIYNDVDNDLDKFANSIVYPTDSEPEKTILVGIEMMESLHRGVDGETTNLFWIDPTTERGVNFSINPSAAENLQEFYKIISTFKFIEP